MEASSTPKYRYCRSCGCRVVCIDSYHREMLERLDWHEGGQCPICQGTVQRIFENPVPPRATPELLQLCAKVKAKREAEEARRGNAR